MEGREKPTTSFEVHINDNDRIIREGDAGKKVIDQGFDAGCETNGADNDKTTTTERKREGTKTERKRRRREANLLQKKEAKRQLQKEKQEETNRLREEKFRGMTEEQMQEVEETKRKLRILRWNRKNSVRLQTEERKKQYNYHLAVDLHFVSLMTPKEKNSLVTQVLTIYGMNNAAPKPFHLHLCEFGGDFVELLRSKIKGFDKWHLDQNPKPPEEMWDTEKIVYMSPDSPNDLEVIEEGTLYVLGGLVDRKRQKGVSIGRASSAGFRTARLPIRRYLPFNGRDTILTLTDVLHLFFEFMEMKDWAAVMAKYEKERRKSRYVLPTNDTNSSNKNSEKEKDSTSSSSESEEDERDWGEKKQKSEPTSSSSCFSSTTTTSTVSSAPAPPE